jgi:B-cell CLL/lymphoma 9 protein
MQCGPGGGPGGRPADIPLNPNNQNMMPAKPSHFDPISSLTQMSQQLTSTGMPNNMNGQQQQQMMGGFNNNVAMMNEMNNQMGMSDGMPPMGNQMDMGGMGNPNIPQFAGPRSMSPKIGPGPQNMGGPGFPGGMPPNMNMRMVRPPMGYNGTNIQVKPNAPNTIQYLPARPQINNTNPPRPPSLDFLQRYTNPMGMDEMNKGMGPQQNMPGNMPYFQNQNNPNVCGGMGGGMGDPLEGNNPMGGINPMGQPNPMMMRGNMGRNPPGNNPMMRFPGNQNPCMMNNNNFNAPPNNPNAMGNPNEQMMFNNQGPQNPQMFVPGPKMSPGPEQMQMHMMGGQGPPPHFKQQQQQQQQQGQPFNSGDPNYAQQYHNFQQQLYATNNPARNQMGMAANQAFMPK